MLYSESLIEKLMLDIVFLCFFKKNVCKMNRNKEMYPLECIIVELWSDHAETNF